MLENSLAEKLIEQVTKYTSYNVNIMNEQGVIIASRNPERIGKFHEVAWQIVHGTSDIMVTENDNEYPGVLSGINMVIDIEGKREGVVGVTGNPEEIRPIALIIKMAIETLIKYENQKMQAFRRQTRKDRFMEMLTQKQYRAPQDIQKLASELNYREDLVRIPILCHLQSPLHQNAFRQTRKDRFMEMLTQKQYRAPQDIQKLASELNYREDLVRIPILCHLQSPLHQNAFLSSIKNSPAHLTQDISFKIEDRYILIFKTLKEEHLFSDYKFLLADYLKSTLKWMREEGIVCTFYIGTFQTSFSQYYYAYQHCKWLERHASGEHQAFYFYDFTGEYLMSCIPRQELQQIFNVFAKELPDEFQKNYIESGEHQAFYFYDFTGEYLMSCIPRQELQQIFNVFAKELPDEFQKNYIEIVGSLIGNNFNIQNAAKRCFMHKNTFTYRYNKIRDILRVSLIGNNFNIQNAAKRCFMHKNTFTYRYNKIRDILRVDHQRSMSDTWMLISLYLYLNP